MANPVHAGSDVSAGTYRCTNCDNEIQVGSTRHLPPCPKCGKARTNQSAAATASTTLTPTARLESGPRRSLSLSPLA
jgi:predicted RNA-binding Zn-ribbon protein involved in translation (DUF1610 family)